MQPKVRKAFPDTAFWAADLRTDARGHAQAKVEFPDSLTTWRATARGVTRRYQGGQRRSKTIVRKNLILRLAVPRFFVQGDEVTISALVAQLPDDREDRARLARRARASRCSTARRSDVDVPSSGEGKVDWRVRAQHRGATPCCWARRSPTRNRTRWN